MVQKTKHGHTESLGDLLRRQREASELSLDDVGKATRIPITTLKAMEADEYDSLPPEAFALGFYRIYAKFINLDIDSVLELYQAHNQRSDKKKQQAQVPTKLQNRIKGMASKPTIGPGTILGFGLVLLVIIGALVSWSMAWNPASYLSSKIRSNGEKTSLVQQDDTASPEFDKVKYYLQAHFPSITKVTVIQDNNKPENYLFQSGDTRSWAAKNNVTMILPEKAKVRLTVNGLLYPLPPPQYGLVTVKIPSN